MRILDDGDIVRGIGFLSIYFGNLEEELDQLIKNATEAGLWPADPDIDRRNFRDKVRHVRRGFAYAFANCKPYRDMDRDKQMVAAVLSACKAVAKLRNELLHLPIFGDPQGRGRAYQKLKDGRQNLVRSSTVYALANRIGNLCGSVYGLTFAAKHIYQNK